MLKSKALCGGLMCLGLLCPAAWAQGQRTLSELIQSIKAQKERELDPRAAATRSQAVQAQPPSARPSVPARAVPLTVVASARSAPVVVAEASAVTVQTAINPSGSAATGPTAPVIAPEPWPLVLSLAGINSDYRTDLMINRQVYSVEVQELPLDLEGWQIQSISERGVCIRRQDSRRCLRPSEQTGVSASGAPNPSAQAMRRATGVGSAGAGP